MEAKHQKHVNLRRPEAGAFGRLEWAILGAPCSIIQELAAALITQLHAGCQIGYVDADHKDDQAPDSEFNNNLITKGASHQLTDKITYARIDLRRPPDDYQRRALMNNCDIVLVNGNHFSAKRQIVIIDPRKEQSLQKKLDRLTQVDMIILSEAGSTPYPFLMQHLGEQGNSIPILQIADIEKISERLRQHWEKARPPLFGLVLAGGKSQRMGEDKGAIIYHQKKQREHVADLLKPLCEKVFVSCRPDQIEQLEAEQPYPVLADTYLGLGPLGAILSAFRHQPDAAWLVVACDLPLLNAGTLHQLISARSPEKMATAFRQPDSNGWPEPLVTIWEPKSYLTALLFLAQGFSCPRKILINNDIHLIDCQHPDALKNVNTQEEKEDIEGLLK